MQELDRPSLPEFLDFKLFGKTILGGKQNHLDFFEPTQEVRTAVCLKPRSPFWAFAGGQARVPLRRRGERRGAGTRRGPGWLGESRYGAAGIQFFGFKPPLLKNGFFLRLDSREANAGHMLLLPDLSKWK